MTSNPATSRISSPVIPFGSGMGISFRTVFSVSLSNSPHPCRGGLGVPLLRLAAAVAPKWLGEAAILSTSATAAVAILGVGPSPPPPSPPSPPGGLPPAEAVLAAPPALVNPVAAAATLFLRADEGDDCAVGGGLLPSSEGLWLRRGRTETAFNPSVGAAAALESTSRSLL